MGKGKSITPSEEVEITSLLGQGHSQREIARRIGRSRKMIQTFIKDKENPPVRRKRGPKPKLSPRTDDITVRRLIQEAKDNPSLSARGLQRKLGLDHVSKHTVRRCLKKYGGEGGWEALMKEEEEKAEANSNNNVDATSTMTVSEIGHEEEDESVGESVPSPNGSEEEEEEEYNVPSPPHVHTPTPVSTVSISNHSTSLHFLREIGALEQAILQTQLVFEEWFQSGGVDMNNKGLLDYLRSLIVKVTEVGSIIPEVKTRLVTVKVKVEEPEEEYLLNEGVLIENEYASEEDEVGDKNEGPLDRYFSAFQEHHCDQYEEGNPTTTSTSVRAAVINTRNEDDELFGNADQFYDPQCRDTKFYTGDDDQANENYDDDEDYDPSASDWDPGVRRKRRNLKQPTNTMIYNCHMCLKRYHHQDKPNCSCDQQGVKAYLRPCPRSKKNVAKTRFKT